jgi:DNA polymerase/3'-5' exonuclease PolX
MARRPGETRRGREFLDDADLVVAVETPPPEEE